MGLPPSGSRNISQFSNYIWQHNLEGSKVIIMVRQLKKSDGDGDRDPDDDCDGDSDGDGDGDDWWLQ